MYMFVQLFYVIEKNSIEFLKILLGRFFGCAAPAAPSELISVGAVVPVAHTIRRLGKKFVVSRQVCARAESVTENRNRYRDILKNRNRHRRRY